MYYLTKRLEISAAHRLTLSYDSKCTNTHGHNWIITVHCRAAELNADGMVTDYHMRLLDGKRHAVLAFKQVNFDVVAMGDSYNDTHMLAEADLGLLFRPSEKVRQEFPQFPVVSQYEEIKEHILRHLGR